MAWWLFLLSAFGIGFVPVLVWLATIAVLQEQYLAATIVNNQWMYLVLAAVAPSTLMLLGAHSGFFLFMSLAALLANGAFYALLGALVRLGLERSKGFWLIAVAVYVVVVGWVAIT